MRSLAYLYLKTCRRSGRSILLLLAIAAAVTIAAFGQAPARDQGASQIRLGLRLFHDARFSSPQGDLQNSCASCHLFDEDPQGIRAHTDFFSRSWVPWRAADPRREELRNSPTILDAALMPRLHFDGEFGSLEDLVKGTFAGRPMGWLPDEQELAFAHVYQIILKDAGEDTRADTGYRSQFRSAYGVDPENLDKTKVMDLAAKAVADYLRTLRSTRATSYDRFVQANGLDAAPARDESAKSFGARLLEKIGALERKGALKLTRGFDATALAGMKVFFRTGGSGSTGNCVTCHTPPLFTDLSFHNMGITQSEYDLVNGEGSFARMEIPQAAEASRPSVQFRETTTRQKAGCADLGYWNFVDLKSSELRRAGESDDRFLQRMIATFKTPTLRNLAYSAPYMHTGALSTLEGAIGELERLSRLAQAGKVREADEELANIKITEPEIIRLAAFLQTLNDDLKPRK